MTEERLSARVRRKMDDGALPLKHSDSVVWASSGRRRTELCSVCEKKITPAQAAYEMNVEDTYHFHIGCHALWQVELIRRRRMSRQTSGAQRGAAG